MSAREARWGGRAVTVDEALSLPSCIVVADAVVAVDFGAEHVLDVLNQIAAHSFVQAMGDVAGAVERDKKEIDHVVNKCFDGAVVVETAVQMIFKNLI